MSGKQWYSPTESYSERSENYRHELQKIGDTNYRHLQFNGTWINFVTGEQNTSTHKAANVYIACSNLTLERNTLIIEFPMFGVIY